MPNKTLHVRRQTLDGNLSSNQAILMIRIHSVATVQTTMTVLKSDPGTTAEAGALRDQGAGTERARCDYGKVESTETESSNAGEDLIGVATGATSEGATTSVILQGEGAGAATEAADPGTIS